MLLRHFLSGSGAPVTVPPTVLRDFAPAQPAIDRVMEHFDDWFLGKTVKGDSRYGYPTLEIADGERRVVGGTLSDPAGGQTERVLWEAPMTGAGILDPDHLSDAQASFGGATMQGFGRFVMERHGNVVTVSGDIDLRVRDIYRFDPTDIFNPGFRHLEPAGVGRSFELATTTWRVPYFARILLDNYGRPSSLGTQIGDTAIPAVPR